MVGSGGAPDFSLVFVESLDSTNTYLANRSALLRPFEAVATLSQTSGRGRQGRTWECLAGRGLALSVALPKFLGPRSSGLYPLIVGTAVLDFVVSEGLSDAHMKWPNDILIRRRKIAGILCQEVQSDLVVAGIGMNVLHTRVDLPSDGATSFLVEGKEVVDIEGFVARLLDQVRQVWAKASVNEASWSSYLAPKIGTIGRRVMVVESDITSWEGIAQGIDNEGHLLVRSVTDGTVRAVVAADVLHVRD